MNGAHRTLALLAVTLAAASSSHASSSALVLREDPKPDVRVDAESIESLRGKLASSDLATRAWGAWGAAEAKHRELAPDVLAALRRTLSDPEVELQPFVLRSLLDAAVRLDARVEPHVLADIESRGRSLPQVIVLASRDPRTHIDLLEFVREKTTKESKTAVDNLLAAHVPARAVELLLPAVSVQVHLRVHDPDSALEGLFRSSGVGCGSVKVPKGLPPTVAYELVREPRSGAERIADGPEPIAMLRTVHRGRSFGFSSSTERFDEAGHALRLLRWIAGDRAKESPLTSVVRIDHPWTNASTYVKQVGEDLLARRAAWRSLLDALVAQKLLPAERIPKTDPFTIEVEDLRADPKEPLPELPR